MNAAPAPTLDATEPEPARRADLNTPHGLPRPMPRHQVGPDGRRIQGTRRQRSAAVASYSRHGRR